MYLTDKQYYEILQKILRYLKFNISCILTACENLNVKIIYHSKVEKNFTYENRRNANYLFDMRF